MHFADLKKTGLSLRELARVLRISHMSVKKIVNGGSLHPAIAAQITPAAEVLAALVEKGKLPMKPTDAFTRRLNVEKIDAFIHR